MTLNLTKPSEGATSWGSAVNQNFTDLENAVNGGAKLLQEVHSSTSSLVTCSTTIPFDDTIPQQTEGTEVLTVTITPKSDTSTLVFEFVASYANTTANETIAALFQGATSNAIAANWSSQDTGSDSGQVTLRHKTTSPGTGGGAVTFKVRVGPSSFSTCYVNGDSASRRLGGVASCLLSVREVEA